MTNFDLGRPLTSYVKVQRILSAARRNRNWQITSKMVTERPYLNLGCGRSHKPGFLNLDYYWEPGIDLCWDLKNPLPIAEGALAGVYSEHCLEHLPLGVTKTVLREMRRVLRQGGTARVALPDAGLFARLYAKALDGEEVTFPFRDGPTTDLGWTPMVELNRVMRDQGHLFGYDAPTLIGLLMAAGFSEASEAPFRVGRDPHLLIDTEGRRPETFYVEAVA